MSFFVAICVDNNAILFACHGSFTAKDLDEKTGWGVDFIYPVAKLTTSKSVMSTNPIFDMEHQIPYIEH